MFKLKTQLFVGFNNWNDFDVYEHEFYDAFRKIEKPFQFIDLSNIFLEYNETLYIDQCHYNDLGAEKLAEKVLESIRPLLNEIRDR